MLSAAMMSATMMAATMVSASMLSTAQCLTMPVASPPHSGRRHFGSRAPFELHIIHSFLCMIVNRMLQKYRLMCRKVLFIVGSERFHELEIELIQ